MRKPLEIALFSRNRVGNGNGRHLTVFILVLALFVFLSDFTYAGYLTLRAKDIVFYLDEDSGSFYAERPSPKSASEKYLMFKDTPPTSYITLIINEKPYKLTDGSLSIIKPFYQTENAIMSEYTVAGVFVKVSFLLTNLRGNDNDSIVCAVNIENRSKKKIEGGARFLIDTTYGEAEGKPVVYLSSSELISYDRLIYREALTEFAFAGKYEMDNPDFGRGFFVYPSINELKPRFIIIGNWKKLDSSEIAYKVNPADNFKYNNYANPDAALGVVYNDLKIKKNETVNIGCVLSTVRVKYGALAKSVDVIKPSNTNVIAISVTNITNTVVNPTNRATNAIVISTNTNWNTNAVVKLTNTKKTNKIKTNQTTTLDKAALEKQIALLEAQAKMLEKMTSLLEKLDSAQTNEPKVITNTQVVTNTIIETDTGPDNPEITKLRKDLDVKNDEIEAIKRNFSDRESDYMGSIEEINNYYKELLKKKEEEYRNASDDYKKASSSKEKRAKAKERLEDIRNTIETLNRKMAVIETLLDMDWNLENMPVDKIEDLSRAIESLSQGLE